MGRKWAYALLVLIVVGLVSWSISPTSRISAPGSRAVSLARKANGLDRAPTATTSDIAAEFKLTSSIDAEERKILARNQNKVEEDAYCRKEAEPSAYEKSVASRKRRIFEYQGLEAAAKQQPNPCVMALLARAKKDVLFYAGQSNDTACRLIKAALLTDQWESEGREDLSPEQRSEGKSILRQLVGENPGNGYYILLLLGAVTANDPERKEELYRQFLLADRFESPLRPMQRRLHELGRKNATALLYSIGLTSSVGVPNFKHGGDMAKYFAKEGFYPEEFSYFVKRLEERMLETDRLKLSHMVQNLTEDATLRMIAISGKIPAQELPSLLQLAGWTAYFKRRVHLDDVSVMMDFSENSCEQILSSFTDALPGMIREQERQFGSL